MAALTTSFAHPYASSEPPAGFTTVDPPEPCDVARQVVARGPVHRDGAGTKGEPSLLASDGAQGLWFAPNRYTPAALWIPVSADTVAEVCARYTAKEPGRGATVYVSIGLVPDLDAIVDELLDADPFCSSLPATPGPASERGTAASRHGVETLYSRSLLTLEAFGALVTARLDYAPVTEQPEVADPRGAVPANVPIDVAAVLLRWPVQGPAELRAALDGPPDRRHHVPALIAAELIGAPLLREDLAHLFSAADAAVRRAALEVAGRRGWTDVLAEARERETDPAILRMIGHYATRPR